MDSIDKLWNREWINESKDNNTSSKKDLADSLTLFYEKHKNSDYDFFKYPDSEFWEWKWKDFILNNVHSDEKWRYLKIWDKIYRENSDKEFFEIWEDKEKNLSYFYIWEIDSIRKKVGYWVIIYSDWTRFDWRFYEWLKLLDKGILRKNWKVTYAWEFWYDWKPINYDTYLHFKWKWTYYEEDKETTFETYTNLEERPRFISSPDHAEDEHWMKRRGLIISTTEAIAWVITWHTLKSRGRITNYEETETHYVFKNKIGNELKISKEEWPNKWKEIANLLNFIRKTLSKHKFDKFQWKDEKLLISYNDNLQTKLKGLIRKTIMVSDISSITWLSSQEVAQRLNEEYS